MLSYKLDFIIGFHPGFDKSSHNFTFQSTFIAGQKMKLLIESINIVVSYQWVHEGDLPHI